MGCGQLTCNRLHQKLSARRYFGEHMNDPLTSFLFGFGILTATFFAATIQSRSRIIFSMVATAMLCIAALSATLATYQVRLRVASFSSANEHISPWRLTRLNAEREVAKKANQSQIENLKSQKGKKDEKVLEQRPILIEALEEIDRATSFSLGLIELTTTRGTGNKALEELDRKLASPQLDISKTGEALAKAKKGEICTLHRWRIVRSRPRQGGKPWRGAPWIGSPMN